MEKCFGFYIEYVQPLIQQFGTQSLSGMHGIKTHTNAVVFRGIDYALSLRQDPIPVIFACACHDMARIDNSEDPEHGKRAIPMTMKIMNQFPDLLDSKARKSILLAILNHTCGQVAPDYVSACLWDADRTRMSWKYGFDSKFFNTLRGAYAAKHPIKYLNFQRDLLSRYKWSKQY